MMISMMRLSMKTIADEIKDVKEMINDLIKYKMNDW